MRAVVQHMNANFARYMRISGHKYQVDMSRQANAPPQVPIIATLLGKRSISKPTAPQPFRRDEALEWARSVQVRTRGRELVGNFNPLLVGELFWEQSSYWQGLAKEHLENVEKVCDKFLKTILEDKGPKDVVSRLRQSLVQDALKVRYDSALEELGRIMEDNKSYPINYNHYYTETINERRQKRQKASLAQAIEGATKHQKLDGCQSNHTSASIDVNRAIEAYSKSIDPDMANFGCEEALDCVFAIYEVLLKVFVANVTTQVVERRMIRGLEEIFSPVVNGLLDSDVKKIASEPPALKRQRQFLKDRIEKLENGQKIFKGIM